MNTANLHIGEQILKVMFEKGITKAALARLLDIKPQSVDYLLKRKSIDTDALYKISNALDFDFSEFFRIHHINSEQTNFDNTKKISAKVLVEIELNAEDVVKLNLKNKIIHILDAQKK